MGTLAQALIQERIEAREMCDAIEYGIRSIDACRNHYGASAAHTAQIEAALAAAGIERRGYYQNTKGALRAAKADATELLRGADAALKQLGGIKQLRLMIAAGETREAAMAC